MSRVPTNYNPQMTEFRPAARPVDTFVTPNARPTGAGSELAQLAQSLRNVQPTIDSILNSRAQAEIEGAQSRAIRDSSQLQLANQQAIKAAVDAGKLPEYENPWYRVQLRQEVAKSELANTKAQVWDEYLQSPERHSENLGEVQKFFSDRFGKLTEGRDAWEMQVIAPGIQNATASMMQAHVNQKDDERQQEMEVGTKRSFAEAFNTWSQADSDGLDAGDPAAIAKQEAMQTNLRNLMAEKGKVIPKAKLEAWLVDAAANATAAGNSGLGRAALNGLTSFDGKSDLGRVYSGVLQHAEEQALDREYHRQQRADYIEARADKKSIEGAEANLFKEVDRLTAQNPNARAVDILTATEVKMKDLDPRVRLRVEQLREYLAGNREKLVKEQNWAAFDRMTTQYFEKKRMGQATDEDKANLLVASWSLQTPEKWPLIEQGLASLKRDRDVETDLGVSQQLRTAWAKGELSLDQVVIAAPKLSDHDQDVWTVRAKQDAQEKHTDQTANVQLAEQKIKTALAAKYIHADDGDEDTKRRMQNQFSIDLGRASADLTEGMIEIDRKKDLPIPEKETLRTNLVNSILKKYTDHPTWEAFQAAEEKRQQVKEELKKNPPKAPPAPLDKEVFGNADHPDKIFDGISHEQTAMAKWAITASKPEKGLADPKTPGSYQERFAQDLRGNALQKVTFLWMEGASALQAPDRPGTSWNDKNDGGPLVEVPNVKIHKAAMEMQARDSAVGELEQKRKNAEFALEHWKSFTTELNRRAALGTPFITQSEKVSLINDTNTAREFVHYRQVFGYTPQEVEKVGTDAWKQYRMFMNDIDLEKNGPKAIQLLKIPSDKWQEFRSAQKELILRDINAVARNTG